MHIVARLIGQKQSAHTLQETEHLATPLPQLRLANSASRLQVAPARRLAVVLTLLVSLLPLNHVRAYTVGQRTWPSSTTTYVKDASFINAGPGWSSAFDDAVTNWNATVFGFISNPSSSNHIVANPTLDCSKLMGTDQYVGSDQYSYDHFVLAVNTNPACGFNWYAGTSSIPAGFFDLRSVLRHELGHALGLGHSRTPGQLMYGAASQQTVYLVDNDAVKGSLYLYNPGWQGRSPEGIYFFTVAYPGSPGPFTYDDTYMYTTYGGGHYVWTHSTFFSRPLNGSASWSNVTGARTSFAFNGSTITRIYTMAFNRGSEAIYIDDVLQSTTSSYAPLTRWQVAKTWTVSPGEHVIDIRKSGSTSTYSDLDAFAVNIPALGAGSYEDPNSSIRYIGTGWTHSTYFSQPSGGSDSWSNTPEDGLTFTFVGNQITYVYTKALNRGLATITIDGIDYGYLDLYAASPQWQASSMYSSLGSGVHTINISVSGAKNGASSDYYVDFDRFIVQ